MWTALIGLSLAAQAPEPVIETLPPSLRQTIPERQLHRHRLAVASTVVLAGGMAIGAPMALFFAVDETDVGTTGSILSVFSFGVTLPGSLLLITALEKGPRLWMNEQGAPTRPLLVRAAWFSFAAGWASIALVGVSIPLGITMWTLGCVTSAALATASVAHNSLLLHSDTLTWSLVATPIKGGALAGLNLRF
jgi:hypothetical protein